MTKRIHHPPSWMPAHTQPLTVTFKAKIPNRILWQLMQNRDWFGLNNNEFTQHDINRLATTDIMKLWNAPNLGKASRLWFAENYKPTKESSKPVVFYFKEEKLRRL